MGRRKVLKMIQSYNPQEESDVELANEIGVPQWMLGLIQRVNTEYCYWGPGEGYMYGPNADKGWSTGVEVKNWKEFEWQLDEWNECVHFYFMAHRNSEKCLDCDGSGYNPETKQLSDDFYDWNETGRKWNDKITQEEVDILVQEDRLCRFKTSKGINPTAEKVNEQERKGPHHHNAINRCILIQARAQRLGIYGDCESCQGEGFVYIEQDCHLGLVLWIIHPRKGASRGVVIKEIKQEDLPAIKGWLTKARERNQQRFAAIDNI